MANMLLSTFSRVRRARIFRMLGLVTIFAPCGLAAAPKEPIRIEYRAHSGGNCPSEAEFDAQVFARTTSARPADQQEPARTFIVRLTRSGSAVVGSLAIQEMDGTTMARRVRGSECADVATVLALATALAIDPRAELAPRETLVERPQPNETQFESPEPDSPLPDPPLPNPPLPNPPWLLRGALGATVAMRVAPRAAWGGSVLLAMRQRRLELTSEVGLELSFRRTGSTAVRLAQARFDFYVARPTLCPLGIEFARWLNVLPCAVLEAGAVTGTGERIASAARRTRFWAAGELLLRLEVALGEAGFATLDGGVQAPLTRYRFVFEDPDTPIHDVPAITGVSALRVGMNF